MQVAELQEFAASRKEPLAEMLARVHAAFLAAGLGEPAVAFMLADAPMQMGASYLDRAIKRFPALAALDGTEEPYPGALPRRRIASLSGAAENYATILEIAALVPKSLPLHGISVQFRAPDFADGFANGLTGALHGVRPGVLVQDNWWVSGRQRSLSALRVVAAEATGKKLPPPPATVQAVLAALGKPRKTQLVPFTDIMTPQAEAPAIPVPPPVSAEVAAALQGILRGMPERLSAILARDVLPHDLPPAQEARMARQFGETTGPMRPALVRAFKPMGYDCKGGSGTFTLRRRSAANLTVALELDVGTWGNFLAAGYSVQGLGFSVPVRLPVGKRCMEDRQYPRGGPERWQQLVDNVAALVAVLDHELVPEIEAITGPSPAWYQPER